jgi:hypothetical protein
MKGPVGTIVRDTKSPRIGVIVDAPEALKEGFSPVQFGETTDSKVEQIADGDLEQVNTPYEVSPDILADNPNYVKKLIADVRTVYVRYGSEKYQLLIINDDALGIRRIE